MRTRDRARTRGWEEPLRHVSITAVVALMLALIPARAGADHDDGRYKQPARSRWTITELDVVVVPPNHGQLVNDDGALNDGDPNELTPTNSYLRAIEEAIEEWRRGIELFGSRSLKTSLEFKVYVLGRDDIPSDVLLAPDILITSGEAMVGVVGVAVSAADPCIINIGTSSFLGSFTYADMFNIHAHEFGHCLGLNHIGLQEDAGDVNHPEHEMMNDTYADTIGLKGRHLHCVSNLNILGLEYVFSNLSGGEKVEVLSLPTSEYATTCEGRGDGETTITTPEDGDTIERASFSSSTVIGTFTGRISSVEIAIRRKSGSVCSWWDGDSLLRGACDRVRWENAVDRLDPLTEAADWARAVSSDLPSGSYRLYSRALDESSRYEERCCVTGRNLISFKLR